MFKALIAYAAACTLALVLAGAWTYRQAGQLASVRGENTTLREGLERAAKQRKADAAVLASRASANAATARELASARASLAAALLQEREWADHPVPDSVRKALEVTE